MLLRTGTFFIVFPYHHYLRLRAQWQIHSDKSPSAHKKNYRTRANCRNSRLDWQENKVSNPWSASPSPVSRLRLRLRLRLCLCLCRSVSLSLFPVSVSVSRLCLCLHLRLRLSVSVCLCLFPVSVSIVGAASRRRDRGTSRLPCCHGSFH